MLINHKEKQMKKLVMASVIGLASLFSFTMANVAVAANDSALNLKVGVIDLQQIVQKSPQMVKINAELEKQFKPRSTALLSMRKNLQAEIEKLNRDGSVMSNADRSALQTKINNDTTAFQKQAGEFQRDLSTAENDARQKFAQQVTTAINSVATAQQYDMIIQKSAVPYTNAKLDVTTQVLNIMTGQKS
jgi:outer membrane protein